MQFKVWDGKANQSAYIKNAVERALSSSLKKSLKKSIAIIEIEEELGYSIE